MYAQHVHRHQRPDAVEQEKTQLEAQDACLRDEMHAQLNFGDIIGELRSLKILQQFQRLTPTESVRPAVLGDGTDRSLVQ